MRRQDALQGSLPLLVLKVLARRGPMHGYAITGQIETLSREILRVEEGSLYPALYRMEEDGWIKARWAITENNRRARIYEVTAKGEKELNAAHERWRTVTAAVDLVLAEA